MARAAALAPCMSCHQLVMMVGYASRLGVPVDVGWLEAVQGAMQPHLEAAVQGGAMQPHLEAAVQGGLQPHLEAAVPLQSDGAGPALPDRPVALSAISSDAEANQGGGGIGLRDTTRLVQVRGGGGRRGRRWDWPPGHHPTDAGAGRRGEERRGRGGEEEKGPFNWICLCYGSPYETGYLLPVTRPPPPPSGCGVPRVAAHHGVDGPAVGVHSGSTDPPPLRLRCA